jgi:hypothetical protein
MPVTTQKLIPKLTHDEILTAVFLLLIAAFVFVLADMLVVSRLIISINKKECFMVTDKSEKYFSI